MLAATLAALSTQGPISLSSATLRHLPLVREAISELGIDRVIGEVLPPDPRMKVTDADCVALMILNVLHGRVALYHMADWLSGTDAEVLLGPDCPAASFTDTRLAETLDRIFVAGTDDVLSAVVRGYLLSDRCPRAYNVHQDTTSVKLYGAFNDAGELLPPPVETDGKPPDPQLVPPVPKHGYSKDHRPDLLQLVYGLSVQGAVGIPLCMSVLDGNTSDPAANRFHIDRLAGLLPPQDEVTLVADCKLCDPNTLGYVLDAAFHFVTLVPRSYDVRDALVEQVRASGEALPVLAEGPRRRKTDPERLYRGRSFRASFPIHDPDTDTTEERELRFLVVASPGLEDREEGVIQARIQDDKARIEAIARKLENKHFSCRDDALRAILPLQREHRFHDVEVTVESKEIKEKRSRRGRPPKGEQAPTSLVWVVASVGIHLDEDAVERARFHARHFVLITDHTDEEAWSDARILTTYREQHIIEGHTGFRWIKGPAAVAPVFLKTPSRVAALGLVLILALMVRNYLEWAVRTALAKTDETLPNLNGQPTRKPSTENVFYYFRDVRIVRLGLADDIRHRELEGLRPEARRVLELMGWSAAIFTASRRKSWGGGCGKAGM